MSNLKEIKLDLSTIVIPQVEGFINKYTVVKPIIDKRKTIDGVSYNTKKAKLIVYENDHKNDNNFHYLFIYEAPDGKFFQRRFTHFGEEPIQLISESKVLLHLNKNKTLF